MGAPFDPQLGLTVGDKEGRQHTLENQRGASRRPHDEVVLARGAGTRLEHELMGAQRGPADLRLANRLSSPHTGEVLAQQAGLSATSADVVDLEGLACDQRQGERGAQDLAAAFAMARPFLEAASAARRSLDAPLARRTGELRLTGADTGRWLDSAIRARLCVPAAGERRDWPPRPPPFPCVRKGEEATRDREAEGNDDSEEDDLAVLELIGMDMVRCMDMVAVRGADGRGRLLKARLAVASAVFTRPFWIRPKTTPQTKSEHRCAAVASARN